jgi:hypothetical protein
VTQLARNQRLRDRRNACRRPVQVRRLVLDAARVGVEAQTSGGHKGRSYGLSGPESLLPADRVAKLGRYLRFEGESDADARAENELPMH